MNRFRKTFLHSLIAVSMLFGVAGIMDAQRRNDRDIRDAVRSLSSKIDDFEATARYQMQSSSAGNVDVSSLSDGVRSLRDSVRRFQDNYDQKRENRDDVNQIVNAARGVDRFLQANPQNQRVQNEWEGVRSQVVRLAANYGVTPNWSTEDEPRNPVDYNDRPISKNAQTVGLSGTYDLDTARSELIDDIISNTGLGNDQREDLKDKLEAPAQIAIDIRGDQVTLATTNAPPVTFTADGRDKVESSASGKSIRVRATLSGDTLTVSSLGGETDYTIKFTSTSNGRGMKVSRRITTDYLSQTVFAESVYNKTDSLARLGIKNGSSGSGSGSSSSTNDPNGGYSDNDQPGNPTYGGAPRAVNARPGNYTVPNGTIITGILANEINTKVSQNNDRFRLTVQSPVEFRGATIDGYISGVGRSGKISGQSNFTFNFEHITLRDGQTYDFAGYLQSVRDQNGKSITVDNEGTARGDNQSRETVKRGSIGAGLGALIGVIAGGGKGAAIGAILGGGAGAGSVVVQGREDIQLQQGSTITLQSSSPIQRDRQDR